MTRTFHKITISPGSLIIDTFLHQLQTKHKTRQSFRSWSPFISIYGYTVAYRMFSRLYSFLTLSILIRYISNLDVKPLIDRKRDLVRISLSPRTSNPPPPLSVGLTPFHPISSPPFTSFHLPVYRLNELTGTLIRSRFRAYHSRQRRTSPNLVLASVTFSKQARKRPPPIAYGARRPCPEEMLFPSLVAYLKYLSIGTYRAA